MVSAEFPVSRNPDPVSDERVAEVLAAPGFGRFFTDHMVTVDWTAERGWHGHALGPYRPLSLDPATNVLHYGQEVFEGLKAYRQPDGSIACFRPGANAERFRASARRLGMPELGAEEFLGAIEAIVGADARWVPGWGEGSEDSLYLRPFTIATGVGLGVNHASEAFRFLLIASPAGSYFSGGIKPVSVWLTSEYVRAAPGGTGFAKCGGNYAAAFVAQAEALGHDCDQVVWLDAVEHRWVEEMGGMNLFFVFGDHVVTPELSGSLLPGITRSSLLELARDAGYTVEERRVSTEEWEKKAVSGELTEVFACGTAAVITPVGHVRYPGGDFDIAGGQAGETTMALRGALTDIQRGKAPDPHGWMRKVG
jgi:branched-chain amino acid aminotransferase